MKHTNHTALVPLLIALAAGLALRLLLWGNIPRTGLISDEGEYLAAATWLAEGRNFTWYQGYLWTRAPVYPLFLAAHLWAFGQSLVPIYVSQLLLSLLNVALVYGLARQFLGAERGWHAPFLAALAMALYLPFALYPQVLLSETLYLSLLLGGFWLLGTAALRMREHGLERGSVVLLVLAGGVLGLATLTRSLTLAFLPVAGLWLAVLWWRQAAGAGMRRVLGALVPLVVFGGASALVVLPWTAYNSLRLYSGPVMVDTTGAFNLMLGARTAYDGVRRDAPPRNFVLALLGQFSPAQREAYLGTSLAAGGSCLYAQNDPHLAEALSRTPIAQAELQQLMTAEGSCLLGLRPLAFAEKTGGEFLDFFQINYSGDERFTDGFGLGRLPRWYTLALLLLDDTLYVLSVPLAALGWWLVRRGTARPAPLAGLVLIWWLFNIGVAPVLFAINRFRLPLLPFVFVFAAAALVALPGARGWWRGRGGAVAVAAAVALMLVSATPYAYFEPRTAGQDSVWASYLGPYPSSIASAWVAWTTRPDFEQQEAMRLALRAGDAAAAAREQPATLRLRRVNRAPAATNQALVDALLAGATGQPQQALALLPEQAAIIASRDVEAAVVRGDMLRSLGRDEEARVLFGRSRPDAATGFVDDANPVQWAWDWLAPAPTARIDLGDDMDLGYVRGCYLGEGDTSIPGQPANYRWCTDAMQIRFPNAGTGSQQTLVLRLDGRAWQRFGSAPTLRVLANDAEAGQATQALDAPAELRFTLPPTVPGQDVVITLRTPTFVADAADYNNQQGPQAGQLRQLGVRLDWVELR